MASGKAIQVTRQVIDEFMQLMPAKETYCIIDVLLWYEQRRVRSLSSERSG